MSWSWMGDALKPRSWGPRAGPGPCCSHDGCISSKTEWFSVAVAFEALRAAETVPRYL